LDYNGLQPGKAAQPIPRSLTPLHVHYSLHTGIYPLQNVYIRKAKILKTPKFDITKLMEVHGDYSEEVSLGVKQ